MHAWSVQVHGDPNGDQWEISIIRDDAGDAQRQWGWFDEKKLLISHNGGHCRWPMATGLGLVMVAIADRYATALNESALRDALHEEILKLLLNDKPIPWNDKRALS